MSFADRDPIAAFAAPCPTPERITAIARALAESISQRADRRHVQECAGCQAELERVLQELNAEPAGFIPSGQLAAHTMARRHPEVARTSEPRAPLLVRAFARVTGRRPLSRTNEAARSPRRVAMAFGIAASVVLTLVTGMVLGASASYASAEVIDAHQREANTSTIASTRRLATVRLDLARAFYNRVQADFTNGTATQNELRVAAAEVDLLEESLAQIDLDLSASRAVTLPPRPPLAILPIRTALTALSCLPAMPAAVKLPTATAALTRAPVLPEIILTPAPYLNPDRARISALATQHQPAVVRGETAADYIVMVHDAADQYVWSTSGLGNFSIEVGGDSRTLAERREYNALHRAELMGVAAPAAGGRGGRGGGVGNSIDTAVFGWLTLSDSSARLMYLDARGARGGRGGTLDSAVFFRRGYVSLPIDSLGNSRGRGGSGGDSTMAFRYTTRFQFDSLGTDFYRYSRWLSTDSLRPGTLAFQYDSARRDAVARGGGGGGRGRGEGSAANTSGSVSGSYITGWFSTGNTTTNDAPGLEQSGNGQSGIQGLASTSVSFTDSYTFPAGELSPRPLRIIVVHLTPGTVWKGR